ncbi:MAG: ABC transporter permease [Candidatus Solibacter sp.]|nr:ABC transporter permease [Candidatus Solibacter sp.]
MHDLRVAFRQLRQTPGFTVLVVLTVALGIGANTAIFSLVNGYARPLPVRSPEQIVVLAAQTKADETGFRFRFSYSELADYRKQATLFSDLFGYCTLIGGITADSKTTEFLYSVVTGNTFSALGLQPAAGRLFLPGEGEYAGAETDVVLGYSYWLKRFGGSPSAVGRQVRIDGRAARIIGVAPKGFHGPYAGADMDAYLPLADIMKVGWWRQRNNVFTNRLSRPLTVLGRMKPGVRLDQAQSAMDVIARRMEVEHPEAEKGIGVRVMPETVARPLPLRFLADVVPVIRGLLLVLAGLVLLLACMNVANLLLVRAAGRQRELAIRAALGSGRGRLVRQMLTESLLLAFLGAVAGVAFGKWGCDALASTIDLATDIPTVLDFSFDWRVFTYALLGASFTGIAIGIWPALRASQTNANTVLHDGRGSGSGSGHPSRQRVRGFLVMAQVAGSLVLLILAGLFVQSLQNVQRLDLGFEAGHLLNVRMDPHQVGYDQPRAADFYSELSRRIKALPGVESATLAYTVPLGYMNDGDFVYPEDRLIVPGEQPAAVGRNTVAETYFDTMKIPMVRGRAFTEQDTEDTPRVAIVNQTMAARFWPNQDPIGKRYRVGLADAPFTQVVGVARDSKYVVVFESSLPYFYLPLRQHFTFMRVLQVRSIVPPEALAVRVQREIRALDMDIPISDLRTMKQSLAGGMGFMMFRLGAFQAAALGVLGLVLAVVGVYGVVSYGATQRTREIGIRMALGAYPGDILRLILRQGVVLVGVGICGGILGALALSRITRRLLVLVSGTDPGTFVAVTLALAAIALVACYIPARRAMRVDPMVALRHE